MDWENSLNLKIETIFPVSNKPIYTYFNLDTNLLKPE